LKLSSILYLFARLLNNAKSNYKERGSKEANTLTNKPKDKEGNMYLANNDNSISEIMPTSMP
jgi:hypothetical protein